MPGSAWDAIWRIFHEASERPASERAAYLAEACAGQPELLREVQSLLEAQAVPNGVVDRSPVLEVDAMTAALGPGEGDIVDRYQLTRLLGEGGMGSVFEAEQLHPVRRIVALKLVKPGMDSREVLRRFEAERQALAIMNHDGIARVYDAGLTEQGRPFFVMERVSGDPVTRFADAHSLPVAQRLALMVRVCRAVLHAHQRGIIHRDLKPSNILVEESAEGPQPKIIDFGIARALDRPLVDDGRTRIGDLVGTPEYMSPEQANAAGLDIDTRSDVYSLGVVLYELLAGMLPFDPDTLRSGGYFELQRILREAEPAPPSRRFRDADGLREEIARQRGTLPARLDAQLAGDLDAITMKALARDRALRYEGVGEMASDIQRYLDGLPVQACAPSRIYRLRKFVARNRLAAVAATVTGLAIIGGIVGVSSGLVVATRERERAETVNAFLEDMLVAPQPENARGGDTTYLLEVLARASEKLDRELASQPEVAARLHATLGNTYRALGEAGPAASHLQRTYELLRGSRGEADADTLTALGELGLAHWEAGDFQQAEELTRRALAGAQRVMEADDTRRLSMLNTLALTVKSLDRLDEAEPLYREVLEARRRTLGVDNQLTLTSMSNLARLLEDAGKLDEAEKAMREVVAVDGRLNGADHPHTLVSMDILGAILRKLGRLEEAEAMHREALAGSVRVMGPDHVDTLGVRFNLAQALAERGDLAGAEAEMREVLAALGRLPDERPFYELATLRGLGDVLYRQQRFRESASTYGRVVQLARQVYPDGNASIAAAQIHHARALAADRRHAEAEALIRSAYPSIVDERGDSHPLAQLAVATMVSSLRARADTAEAERWSRLPGAPPPP